MDYFSFIFAVTVCVISYERNKESERERKTEYNFKEMELNTKCGLFLLPGKKSSRKHL